MRVAHACRVDSGDKGLCLCLAIALARGLPVVLDLSVAPFLDEDGVEALRNVATDCAAAGPPVVFAETVTGVLKRMKTAGMIVPGLTFPTVTRRALTSIRCGTRLLRRVSYASDGAAIRGFL